MIRALVFATLALVCLGCQLNHRLYYAKMPVFTKGGMHNIRIEGELNRYRLDILREGMEALPEKAVRSVKYVVYYTDQEHLAGYYCGTKEYPPAHTSYANPGVICVNANSIPDKSNVYHEVTHVYLASLSGETEKQWVKIAGDIYRPNYKDYWFDFYQFGVLGAYAVVNVHEHLAVTVEEIYQYVIDNNNEIERAIANFSTENKKKLIQQLDLLLNIEAIDEKIHGKIKALCEK